MPRTTRSGIQRTRCLPNSSSNASVCPPSLTSKTISGRGTSHGLPRRSHLSVSSTCQPSRMAWSKMPNS